MARTLQENLATVLRVLAEQPTDSENVPQLTGQQLSDITGLRPIEINDAVSLLVQSGYAEWLQEIGTGPYEFGFVLITARGRYEYERVFDKHKGEAETEAQVTRPPLPVGSPYGFSDEDWEIVSEKKSRTEILYVVFGHQFRSEYYDTEELKKNVENMLLRAVNSYNQTPGAIPVRLYFSALGAGYGEHLFNEIARDIVGADIAVFETSDLNPNVMVEIGVALTWGVRVLPIKLEGRPKPPSDISGQTWADYRDNGRVFVVEDHERKLIRMVDRAVRKKGRA